MKSANQCAWGTGADESPTLDPIRANWPGLQMVRHLNFEVSGKEPRVKFSKLSRISMMNISEFEM
jgi:hypothetical protein